MSDQTREEAGDHLSSQIYEEEDLFVDDLSSLDEESAALAHEAVAQHVMEQTSSNQNDNDETKATTLHNRLAGASAHKAGLDSVDKDKVNRIIYETSKGSAFFENERKRDESLTKRLDEMLHQYSVIKDLDLSLEKQVVDHKIQELEAGRDLTQCICHVDMDAFYASVEELDNPALKEIPMAVGGLQMLCTSNYLARQSGVRSGMPGYIAKKLCPELTMIPLHFPKYRAASAKVRAVLAKYDPEFLPMSLDEAYLNLTNYLQTTDQTPEQVVEQMRAEIFKETQLTASAGIAANRMLAKICSDFNKPNGQYMLPMDRDTIMAFTKTLSLRKVSGVGRVTERILQALDVQTCGDVFERRAVLYRLLSPISFQFMLKCYLGLGTTHFNLDSDRKSISVERTFAALSEPEELYRKVDELAALLAKDLQQHRIRGGKTVGIKLKETSFEVRVRSKTFPTYISKKEDIARIAKSLVEKELPISLRLMGIRLASLPPKVDDDHGVKKYFRKRKNSESNAESSDAPRKVAVIEDKDGQVQPQISQKEEKEEKEELDELDTAAADTETMDEHDTRDSASEAPYDALASIVTVTCPICNRSLELDNIQFNQHVDECLTKVEVKAILLREQQHASSSSPRSSPSSSSHTTPTQQQQQQQQERSLLDYYRAPKSSP